MNVYLTKLQQNILDRKVTKASKFSYEGEKATKFSYEREKAMNFLKFKFKSK